MALSSDILNQINLRGVATVGQKYYGDDGKVYIGIPIINKPNGGRLKVLETSNTIPTKLINQTIQESLNILEDKQNSSIKQVEINFGPDLYQTQRIFNIVDSDIKQNNKIVASLAYNIPTLKSLDELEMDEIIFKCKANNGSIDILATSLYGSVYGYFKINYIIN